MRPGGAEEVLDFGCGTATLMILIKRRSPSARVRDLDMDKAILAMARRKAQMPGVDEELDGYDGMKRNALREIYRGLKPAGELYVFDFDRAKCRFLKLVYKAVRLLDGRKDTRANAMGVVGGMVDAAGFDRVEELARHRTAVGEVTCIGAGRGDGARPHGRDIRLADTQGRRHDAGRVRQW